MLILGPPSAPQSVGFALGVLALFTGCAGTPESEESVATPREIVDLVEAFPGATTYSLPQRLVLTEAAARPYLISGWTPARRADPEKEEGEDVSAIWTFGEFSEAEFFSPAPMDLRLRADLGPSGVAPGSIVEVSVNGRPAGQVKLGRGVRRYELELSSEWVAAGVNRLRFLHPAALTPGLKRVKDLRLRWRSLHVEPAASVEVTGSPYANQAQQALFVPFGTRVDFMLDLPTRSRLSFERAQMRGVPAGKLTVEWTSLEGEVLRLTDDLSSLPVAKLEISGDSRAEGRLSLTAISRDWAESKTAGVLLMKPVIETLEDLPLPPAIASAPTLSPLPDADRPHILVYMIDTLRADRLSAYGYGRPTSPRLEEFASRATLFENAQAQSPWTRASVASIFTGLAPPSHGANDDPDVLSGSFLTIAEALQGSGYETVSFSANVNAGQPYGFAQGFDRFKRLIDLRPGEHFARSSSINEAVLSYLESRDSEKPLFLWVHTIDPHAPYQPEEHFKEQFAPDSRVETGTVDFLQGLIRGKEAPSSEVILEISDLYDAEVAANDAGFGALMDALGRLGLAERTAVIVVSDHGEELYDHGSWTHGKTLHEEMLRIPLIIRQPGHAEGRRVTDVVEHVDLFPTLLELAGLNPPLETHGTSLVPYLKGEEIPATPALAFVNLRGRHARSMIEGSWKVIAPLDGESAGYPQVFDRRKDREETTDLGPDHPVLARFLAAGLDRQFSAFPRPEEGSAEVFEADPELRKELEALGYLQ